MTRHRWYRATWPFALETLAKRLRAAEFSYSSGEGYIVDRWRKDTLEARYVQKLEVEEELVDPFGERILNRRTAFYETRFAVTQGGLLEVIDPGRGTQRFVSSLLEVTDFSLVIEPLRIDLDEWTRRLSDHLDAPHFVSLVQIAKVPLGPGISGKFVFEGPEDVRRVASEFMGRLKGEQQKLQVVVGGEQAAIITLSANASARVSRDNDTLAAAVRKSVPPSRI